MPCTDVEAVPTLLGLTRDLPEVLEVGGGAARVVLVVPSHRIGDRLEASPRARVRGAVVGERCRLVLVVAESQDSVDVGAPQQCGSGVSVAVSGRRRVLPEEAVR